MKKKNFKSLKLNKKSISQLYGNAIKGGSYTTFSYTYFCTVNCTDGCPETEACPSSWIYLCNDCDTTTAPPQ